MNAQGQPVQVPAGALQAANVQNNIGKIHLSVKYVTEWFINQRSKCKCR